MTGALLALCVLCAALFACTGSCVCTEDVGAQLDAGARDAAPAPTERPDLEGHAGIQP